MKQCSDNAQILLKQYSNITVEYSNKNCSYAEGVREMVRDFERKIDVEIERTRIRVKIFHGEDEEVVKLNLEEAEEFADKLVQAIEDYSQRKQIRID
jgi:hypothetical protein